MYRHAAQKETIILVFVFLLYKYVKYIFALGGETIMKKIKRFLCALLAMSVVLSTSVTAQAASGSASQPRYYTEKEQTSTGIKYGKSYRITTIKVYYTYADCVKLNKRMESISGNGYIAASILAGLVPSFGGITSAIMGCIGMSANNYKKVFSTAVRKHTGVEISYDYWQCVNSPSIHDNRTTNYHLRYK